MHDRLLRLADEALAEGDYVRAMECLETVSPAPPEVQELLRTALHRLRTAATRELTAGRWTVAEGIFDVLAGYQRHFTPEQQKELDLFLEELQRLRAVEKRDIMVRAATSLAAGGLHAEAAHLAVRTLRESEDPHLVGRMRNLLQGLPHPHGRLLLGFKSAMEIRLFCKLEGGARVEIKTDPPHVRQAASGRVHFPGPDSRLILLDVPLDWSGYEEINFWGAASEGSSGEYLLTAGDGRASFTFLGEVTSRTFTQERIPLEIFQPDGEADWTRITRLLLSTPGPGPADFFLDEIRLRPRA